MSRSRRWRKNTSQGKEARANLHSSTSSRMEEKADYSAWSHEKLIERVTALENELKEKNQRYIQRSFYHRLISLTRAESSVIPLPTPEKKSWKKPRSERVFDPTKYSTRLVALKLAYLGKRYNGFEYSKNNTALPTIEEELWKALNRARLIFPEGSHPLAPGEINWEGCDYSKCGRTDKGVSAFGQVIGIRVRSNRPLGRRKETLPRENAVEMGSPALAPSRVNDNGSALEELNIEDPDFEEALNFDPIADEIQYPSILNRLLPPDIRILAWCPAPPLDFSARFSCRERQYRYFFTQPAFAPTPHHLELPFSSSKAATKVKDGWLNIDAMREAAKLFEGRHDFRNFCKVDPGKQISNFERKIFYADIEEVDDSTGALAFINGQDFLSSGVTGGGNPKIYTFTLHGSAFLWHQVRCMVAKPSIISELLDVEKNPCRPTYEMATDTPLVLWNCVFPHENDPERKDALQWVYVGEGPRGGELKYGSGGLMEDLWKVWRERKVDEILAGSLIDVVSKQGGKVGELSPGKLNRSQKVFDGGDAPRLQGTYTRVMKKPLMDRVEVQNEKYAVRKGFENAADLKAQGFRRLGSKVPVLDDADE
jgi:tRNA pseudouridine38/39 synthase